MAAQLTEVDYPGRHSPSPQSSDGAEVETEVEDDDPYGDQDDAQSFIQPAISPIATRLTSPRTPAAEKAAAMDDLVGGGLFDAALAPLPAPVPSPSPPSATDDLPTPWRVGPGRFTFTESAKLPSMSGVFQTRPHRSSSLSENALKRLSKALPSISIPAGFLPTISTPSFLSSFGASFQKDGPEAPAVEAPAPPDTRTHSLRKAPSDDSLLYHSLSRVSSFGDDERFAHVREQVNSRFKAIKDSFDGPSFKMPQIHSMLCPPPSTWATPVDKGFYHGLT